VAVATVLFLVDGKLVLLQPSTTDGGQLKYDMRVIAQGVEFYTLIRDQPLVDTSQSEEGLFLMSSPSETQIYGSYNGNGLRDSLWYFDGNEMKVWIDIQDVLGSAPSDSGRELPPVVNIPLDFYPLSTLLGKGIILGVESELVQRRDVNFAFFRFAIRVWRLFQLKLSRVLMILLDSLVPSPPTTTSFISLQLTSSIILVSSLSEPHVLSSCSRGFTS